MTPASLIAYLKTGQLGPFGPLCPHQVVLATLGSPPFWFGHGTFSYQRSDIWVYDSVQFNFDEHMRLEDTLVHFHSEFDGTVVTYSNWNGRYISLDDLSVETICTPERFLSTMSANDIATSQQTSTGGQVLINTSAGVQASFCPRAQSGAYNEDGTRIFTDGPYLYSITTIRGLSRKRRST